MASEDSFGAKGSLEVGGADYRIFRLDAVQGDGLDVASLPSLWLPIIYEC